MILFTTPKDNYLTYFGVRWSNCTLGLAPRRTRAYLPCGWLPFAFHKSDFAGDGILCTLDFGIGYFCWLRDYE